MEFYKLLEDENSYKDGFIEQDFLSPDNLKVNQVENIQEKKEIENEVIYINGFEKAFNTVFNQKNSEIMEDNEEINENSPPVIHEQINENSYIKSLNDERIIVNVKEQNDKFFPFTKGVGLDQTLKSIGLTANYNSSSSKISLLTCYNNQLSITSKFRTTDYYTDENGKRKKQKKKRKFKPDDIRKKIKARFHKIIKNIINSKLKKAGAKKLFDFFPQSFITNITIKLNKQAFNLTYEKLIYLDFSFDANKKRGIPDIEKYNKNLEVLKYLNENDEICKKSDFEKIKNMKYMDILRAYFSSLEFEQTIIELYQKKEKLEYIEEYVNKALNYVNFFAFNKKKLNVSKSNIFKIINKNEENEEVEEDESEY